MTQSRGVLPTKEKIKEYFLQILNVSTTKVAIEDFKTKKKVGNLAFFASDDEERWKLLYKRDFNEHLVEGIPAKLQYQAALYCQEAKNSARSDRANFFYKQLGLVLSEMKENSLRDYYSACIHLYGNQFLVNQEEEKSELLSRLAILNEPDEKKAKVYSLMSSMTLKPKKVSPAQKGFKYLLKSHKEGNPLAVMEAAKILCDGNLNRTINSLGCWIYSRSRFNADRHLAEHKFTDIANEIVTNFSDLIDKLIALHKQGEPLAARYLGIIYRDIQQEKDKAIEWFKKGLKKDLAFCLNELTSLMLGKKSPEEFSETKAYLETLESKQAMALEVKFQLASLSALQKAKANGNNNNEVDSNHYTINDVLSHQGAQLAFLNYALDQAEKLTKLEADLTFTERQDRIEENKKLIISVGKQAFEAGVKLGGEAIYKYFDGQEREDYFKQQFEKGNELAAIFLAKHYIENKIPIEKCFPWIQLAVMCGDITFYHSLRVHSAKNAFAAMSLALIEHHGLNMNNVEDVSHYPLPNPEKATYYFKQAMQLNADIVKEYLKGAAEQIKDPIFMLEAEKFFNEQQCIRPAMQL